MRQTNWKAIGGNKTVLKCLKERVWYDVEWIYLAQDRGQR